MPRQAYVQAYVRVEARLGKIGLGPEAGLGRPTLGTTYHIGQA